MTIREAEKLKALWTDKLVRVRPGIAELRRFEGRVGRVRTVNMNGRALVEFEGGADISWYDIAPAFLRRIPASETSKAVPSAETSSGSDQQQEHLQKNSVPASQSLSPIDQIRAAAASGRPHVSSRSDSTAAMALQQPPRSADKPAAEPPQNLPNSKPPVVVSQSSAQSPVHDPASLTETPTVKSSMPTAQDTEPGTKPTHDALHELQSHPFSQLRRQARVSRHQPTHEDQLRAQAARPAPDAAADTRTQRQRAEKPSPAQVTDAAVEDDLQMIEGIGPGIAALLRNSGIATWAQLAQTEPAAIRDILRQAGPQFAMHDPATWPRQAQLAADGNRDELRNWQQQLKGGRES